MLVCLPCKTPMVVGYEFYTVWIAQTQKEHPVEVAKCPRCDCTVADVRGQSRPRPGGPARPRRAVNRATYRRWGRGMTDLLDQAGEKVDTEKNTEKEKP